MRSLGRLDTGGEVVGFCSVVKLDTALLIPFSCPVLGPEAQAMALLPPLYRIEDVLRYTLHGMQRIGADVKLTLRP